MRPISGALAGEPQRSGRVSPRAHACGWHRGSCGAVWSGAVPVLAALALCGQFRDSRILMDAGYDVRRLTSAGGGTMTGMLTDLETLADQMRLPAGEEQ